MLLVHLGEADAANRVDAAIAHVVAKKLTSMQAGKMGYSTSQVGDLVADATATL
jgi:3-isopropylmalate dehydrogenase